MQEEKPHKKKTPFFWDSRQSWIDQIVAYTLLIVAGGGALALIIFILWIIIMGITKMSTR